jgi:formylglycine-generating enzyme required for sulfatase activity
MFCPKCGQENVADADFCVRCGVDLSTLTPGRLTGPSDTLSAGRTILAEELRLGKILAGQYRIISEGPLGAGGMGEVWKAEDTELGVAVAVKVLPAQLARDETAMANLRREALIGRQLSHPHICRLYGFHSDGRLKFIVMEYVEGKTLRQLLNERPEGKYTWEELEPIARQLGEALDYAHTVTYRSPDGRTVQGILHRDIKPQNIMVTAAGPSTGSAGSPQAGSGQAKLMDFGIAREIHNSMTQVTGRTSQTPMYASPEQFRGERMTAASDIYSFTAVLYECLAGHPLVSPHGDLSWQILQREWEPLGDQSEAVNALLRAGLARKASERRDTTGGLLYLTLRRDPSRDPAPAILEPPEAELTSAPERCLTLSLDHGVEMKLALIPAGTFPMGSPAGESGRQGNESPQRQVRISAPFYMGIHEVTQAQYAAVMGSNPSHFRGEQNPVESVSHNDAVEFCRKLSGKTGREVRLPTEAEWEYACRAGTIGPFHTGETISTAQANYDGNYIYGNGKKGVFRQKTFPVGSFDANDFGLYDMHGNVWEWCSDWYQDSYSDLPSQAPKGPNTGVIRVLRGGSWLNNPRYCRSAYRNWSAPGVTYFSNGFRVVVSLD